MGIFSTDAKNSMLGGINPTYASLHTADPGATGINEVTGGTPAYARKAIVFDAAAAGARALSVDATFDVPACTVAYVGYWTAITAGTFLGSDPVTNETFAAQGQYKLLAAGTSLTISDS